MSCTRTRNRGVLQQMSEHEGKGKGWRVSKIEGKQRAERPGPEMGTKLAKRGSGRGV